MPPTNANLFQWNKRPNTGMIIKSGLLSKQKRNPYVRPCRAANYRPEYVFLEEVAQEPYCRKGIQSPNKEQQRKANESWQRVSDRIQARGYAPLNITEERKHFRNLTKTYRICKKSGNKRWMWYRLFEDFRTRPEDVPFSGMHHFVYREGEQVESQNQHHFADRKEEQVQFQNQHHFADRKEEQVQSQNQHHFADRKEEQVKSQNQHHFADRKEEQVKSQNQHHFADREEEQVQSENQRHFTDDEEEEVESKNQHHFTDSEEEEVESKNQHHFGDCEEEQIGSQNLEEAAMELQSFNDSIVLEIIGTNSFSVGDSPPASPHANLPSEGNSPPVTIANPPPQDNSLPTPPPVTNPTIPISPPPEGACPTNPTVIIHPASVPSDHSVDFERHRQLKSTLHDNFHLRNQLSEEKSKVAYLYAIQLLYLRLLDLSKHNLKEFETFRDINSANGIWGIPIDRFQDGELKIIQDLFQLGDEIPSVIAKQGDVVLLTLPGTGPCQCSSKPHSSARRVLKCLEAMTIWKCSG